LKELEIKIKLEALITRRCAMVSVNEHLRSRKEPIVHLFENFQKLEQEMLDLAKIARDSD